MNHDSFLSAPSGVSLLFEGQVLPLRNAAIECTHCRHALRLSEVPISIAQRAPAQLDCPLPPVSPAPLSAPVLYTSALRSPVLVSAPSSEPASPAIDCKSPPSTDTETADEDFKTEEHETIETIEIAESTDNPDEKKWRWSPELKEHFVKAFEILQSRGIHATPKKIMGLMRQNGAPIEQLTMRRVQSHHQKYIKRLKTAKSGKKAKQAQAKKLADAVKLTDLSEGAFSDHFDAEVLRLTGGVEPGVASGRDDSPMFFTSIAGSPTPSLRSTPTTPIASPVMTSSYNYRSSPNAAPLNFSRGQGTVLSGSFVVPSAQKPVGSPSAKFTPNTDMFGSLSSFAPGSPLWQQYMMSGTVLTNPAEKHLALANQANQSLPLSLSPASAFSKMSIQQQYTIKEEHVYLVPSPRTTVLDEPFYQHPFQETSLPCSSIDDMAFSSMPALADESFDAGFDMLGYLNDGEVLALTQ
eukprot:TRINITY_DN1858_c0_g1_i1.p1 TRINITY_DN1858_c0_g1~~TRINITY_DN1858_c0_g1_i1.p1  ORF type:complete len:467 (+),score=188.75 TRINITY_DN1858_c0_g1_i1:191-1591(+)